VKSEMQRLTQEVEELGRQWQARKDIQADAAIQQCSKRASTFVTGLIEAAETDAVSKNRGQSAKTGVRVHFRRLTLRELMSASSKLFLKVQPDPCFLPASPKYLCAGR
jgi:hypothetical protein